MIASSFVDFMVNEVIASPLLLKSLRPVLLGIFGVSCNRATVSPRVFFGGSGVKIGARSFINRGVFFDASAEIAIEDDVAVGMNAQLITGSHAIGDQYRRAGHQFAQPISIGRGVWIGAGAIILPGVKVGSGAVVAAGSVVIRDCAENCLYAGVPAAFVRDLETDNDAS
ncbi:acyltransferase [Microbacterium sp. NPDC090007]|uniref:acyltransferase n=1 Tax=Microbacterium sp. NPDC090007 TaxID=3364204 RepID=UPI003810A731